MNINLKFLSLHKNKSTFRKDYFQINPDKYWNLLLIIFFILSISGLVLGYVKFNNLNKEFLSYAENTTIETPEVKQKDEITKVLNYFIEKENKEKDFLENKKILVIDPSL